MLPTIVAPSAQRVGAVQEALLQTDAELTALTAIIEAGSARRKRRVKTFKKAYMSFTAVALFCFSGWIIALLCGIMNHTVWSLAVSAGSILVTPIALLVALLWLRKDKSTEQERTAVSKLVQRDDVRAVAPLMDAISYIGDRETRLKIWQGLGRLWPLLSEDEAQNLGAERLGLLTTWMQGWEHLLTRSQNSGPGTQPLLGMLHVLGRIGQSRIQTGQPPISIRVSVLPILKKWEAGKGAGQDPAVQQAAVACREAIQAKMSLAHSSEYLLRASTAANAGPKNLLRPAQNTQQTDPQELLRPRDPE